MCPMSWRLRWVLTEPFSCTSAMPTWKRKSPLRRKAKTETRTVLRLHPLLAPYKAAVFPLIRKDGLTDIAREIINTLKYDHNVMYDEKDSVGKRYRRHDAIGTPFCITVDYETKERSNGYHTRSG